MLYIVVVPVVVGVMLTEQIGQSLRCSVIGMKHAHVFDIFIFL